jgi:signal transduction histidine kinase
LPITEVVRSGELLLIPNKEGLRARYPEFIEFATYTSAWALVPLLREGRGLGVMTLMFNREREFSEEDQSMILALSRQCALALERARLYEVERQARAQLETQVEQRTVELQREMERRREAQRQLEQSREAERTRIARELHDELGGALTGLKMDLSRLIRQPHTSPAVAAELSRTADDVDQTVRTVRRIATELRPVAIDDFGLVAALQQHFEDFRRRTGLAGAFESEADDLPLSAERATACFRIVQEALTNVARHAQATRVNVHIGVRAGKAVVRVRDDGRGMDPARQDAGHLGLIGMRERAELITAALAIETAPGQGTAIILEVPLDMATP